MTILFLNFKTENRVPDVSYVERLLNHSILSSIWAYGGKRK
jgi:hypothetical protein